MLDYLAALAVPALVIATKLDKLNRGEQTRALRAIAAGSVPVVPFSAVTGDGVPAVWKTMAEWTRPQGGAARRRAPR